MTLNRFIKRLVAIVAFHAVFAGVIIGSTNGTSP